jgi:hypothetical protein
MIDRTEECFGIKPDWFVADTAYGSAENLAWLVKKRQIIPFIPLITARQCMFTCTRGRQVRAQRRNMVAFGF